jgi:RimJ/RimL family protein N-acetyltransferase
MTLSETPGRLIHETPRLRLRELTADDAGFILELVNEPAWLRYIGDRNVHSLEDARGYIARGPVASYAKNGFGLWAVALRRSPAGAPAPAEGASAPDELIGMCGLIRRDSLPHPDLGFAFLAGHRGHGYAREAAAAAVALARERFQVARLLAVTDPDNSASQAVLEHAGFVFERHFTWSEAGKEQALYTQDLA